MGNPHQNRKTIIVIPARFASSRLPGKPLADILGKPMIQWVHERARKVRGIDRVIVATDDERIATVVRGFGGEVVMTSTDLQSGTDRVAAVADLIAGGDADVFVNVQGDEPLIEPAAIETALGLVGTGAGANGFQMATAMTRLRSEEELLDPSVVKVIADRNERAIYFSRLPIPYSRGVRPARVDAYACFRHVGLYVYTRAALMRFRKLVPSAIEQGEVLEQLRAVEDGIAIGIREVDFTCIGVDTPEDLEKVRQHLRGSKNG